MSSNRRLVMSDVIKEAKHDLQDMFDENEEQNCKTPSRYRLRRIARLWRPNMLVASRTGSQTAERPR
jgi:hypothetical protein